MAAPEEPPPGGGDSLVVPGLALALDLLDVIKRQQGDLESLKRQLGL